MFLVTCLIIVYICRSVWSTKQGIAIPKFRKRKEIRSSDDGSLMSTSTVGRIEL